MDTIIGLLFILGFAFMLIYGTFLYIQEDILHDNKRCPHNIRGGVTRKLCEICVNQAYEELQRAKLQKQKEEQEKQRKLQIIIQAGTLQRHEIERLKKIQLQKKDYIRSLSPQQFENVVADIFSNLGYVVKQTPYSNDGGRDAILTKDGKTYLLECKLYSPDNTIGRRDLQIFFAAMQGDKAGKGFYVNTGRFASTAKEYAKANNIELISIDKLVEMMGEVFPNTNNESISMSVMCIECGDIVKFSLEKGETEKSCTNKHNINLLTQKEYCDKCGQEMNEINGPYSKFWGCMGYPTCRNTKPYVSKAKLLDSFARKEQSNSLLKPNESEKPIVIDAGEGNENLWKLLQEGGKVISVELPKEKTQSVKVDDTVSLGTTISNNKTEYAEILENQKQNGNETIINIPASIFNNGVYLTSFASLHGPHGQYQSIKETVLIRFNDNQVKFVATDGHRMAIYNKTLKSYNANSKFIISTKFVSRLTSYIDKNSSQNLKISIPNNTTLKEENIVIFEADKSPAYSLRLLDQVEYPEYEHLLEGHSILKIKINNENFSQNIAKAKLEKADTTLFKFENNSLEILSYNEWEKTNIKISTTFTMPYNNNMISLKFNINYIQDFLEHLNNSNYKTSNIIIHIIKQGELGKSIIFSDEMEEYKYLLMPYKQE